MGWKEWHYWIKGVVIGFIIAIILSILGIFVQTLSNNRLLTFIAHLVVDPCVFYTQCNGNSCLGCIILGPLFTIIHGIILGLFIGIIYGKLKNS